MTDQFNTHPQPRTFAPSKEDVLQNLQYFFGAPVSPEKLKDYSEQCARALKLDSRASAPCLLTTRVACRAQPCRHASLSGFAFSD